MPHREVRVGFPSHSQACVSGALNEVRAPGRVLKGLLLWPKSYFQLCPRTGSVTCLEWGEVLDTFTWEIRRKNFLFLRPNVSVFSVMGFGAMRFDIQL